MEWRPTACLSGDGSKHPTPDRDYVLLILNQPILDFPTFKQLWKQSSYRICADGGANRLFDLFGAVDQSSQREDYLPDLICGDLDSIRPNVESYYGKRENVKLKEDKYQGSTDFEKCLREAKNWGHERKPPIILNVIGSLGGRVDQGLSLIHHLYKASLDPSFFPGRIFLFSDESISFILNEELNFIHTPLSEGYLTENVGILPIGRPAVITTQGLRWNVSDWTTEIGGQVSTSNHIRKDVIAVHTTERVLFTVERVKDRDVQDIPLIDITNR